MDLDVTDLGEAQLAAVEHAETVAGEPCRLGGAALLEAGSAEFRTFAFAAEGLPPVAVRQVEVSDGLLLRHVAGLREPSAFSGQLCLSDHETLQSGAAWVLLPLLVETLAQGESVIPHHANATEGAG